MSSSFLASYLESQSGYPPCLSQLWANSPWGLKELGLYVVRVQGALPEEAIGHTLQAQKLEGWSHALESPVPPWSCISSSWSQARAGRIGHSGIPPTWRGARSTSTFDFSVKRVPWAQAVGASGAGRCLDSRLPDVPGRMWLSLGEGGNPAPPLQTLFLPQGILRKRPPACSTCQWQSGGRGREEALAELGVERITASIFQGATLTELILK